jgi:coatomer protein complex subunit epsilon
VKEAIKILRHALTIEQNAILVQLYLRIDRLDLAQKQVQAMKVIDEDGVLGMLATAWTHLNLVQYNTVL